MMFTCTYTDTEAVMKEYYYKVKMRRSQIMAVVGLVLALGCLGFFFSSWQFWDLIVPVLGGYYVITQFLAPAQAVKKELKQLDYQYDGNRPEKVCTVDGLGITCRLPNEEKTIAFADALAVYEIKTAIVVASIDTQIVLDKNGFAQGQMEACLAHIKKRCPNCPHYKR